MIPVRPFLVASGSFIQCLSDSPLGLLRLIDDDRNVWTLVNATLQKIGVLAPDSQPNQLNAGFHPDGSMVALPVADGIGVSDLAGHMLWRRSGMQGAVFTRQGSLVAWGYPSKGTVRVTLLDSVSGTSMAEVDVCDPPGAQSSWLQPSESRDSVWALVGDGNRDVVTHELLVTDEGLLETDVLPDGWLPLDQDSTGDLLLAVNDTQFALGIWSRSSQTFTAMRELNDEPGYSGFFLPGDRYVVAGIDTDLISYSIADVSDLNTAENLAIVGLDVDNSMLGPIQRCGALVTLRIGPQSSPLKILLFHVADLVPVD